MASKDVTCFPFSLLPFFADHAALVGASFALPIGTSFYHTDEFGGSLGLAAGPEQQLM
jgi:hypothetical protein